MNPERLGRLYGREVRVAEIDGQIAVVIGRPVDSENDRSRAAQRRASEEA